MAATDTAPLEERLAQIIRTIAGSYWIAGNVFADGEVPEQTRIETTREVPEAIAASFGAEGKDADSTWFVYWDRDANGKLNRALVHIPVVLLQGPEEIAKGCAAHEAGHLAITRKHCLVPDEVLAKPGFSALLAASEERATDHVVEVRYPGAGRWLRQARLAEVRKCAAAGERWTCRGVPRYLQLCNAIIYAPHGFDVGDCLPEVREVFDRIRDDVAEIERTLPHEHAGERQIREAALERYRIAYTRMWPLVEPLVAADLRDEAERLGEAAAAAPASGEEQARLALLEIEAAMAADGAGTLEPGVGRMLPPSQAFACREESPARPFTLGSERTPWDEAYGQVSGLDGELSRRLEDIFSPQRAARPHRRQSGARLNLRAAFAWEARRAAGADQSDPRLFERRERPLARDHAVSLLVDLSGSMEGEKLRQAFLALVLLVEVLCRLDIAVEVLGFRTELLVFKDFSQPLGQAVRERMQAIPHSADNGNADGPCLLEASRRLAAWPASVKILLVISDGLPADGPQPEQALHDAVSEIVATTGQILVGIGLGEGTEHVGDFYPVSFANTAAKELPQRLADLLEGIILETIDPER